MIQSYEVTDARIAAQGTLCTVCGRPLKNFQSVQIGMGPVCRAGLVGLKSSEDVDEFGRPKPRYAVIKVTDAWMLVRDIGPWDVRPTITNVPEIVVEELRDRLEDRKLYYIDSYGEVDELIVKEGRFRSFAPGAPEEVKLEALTCINGVRDIQSEIAGG